jgi:hypothetical protein
MRRYFARTRIAIPPRRIPYEGLLCYDRRRGETTIFRLHTYNMTDKMTDAGDPAMDTTQHDRIALRQALERFLDCPTAENQQQVATLTAAYQTLWINERAGAPAAAPAKPTQMLKAPPRLAEADRAVLVKLADGWVATAADAPRWAWFEDRELIRMEPGPDGEEILVLTDLGRAAAGR